MTDEARPTLELRLSALACVLVAVVLFFGPYLSRVDRFYDDAAQHIFWLYQYTDAELLPNDLSVAYFHTSAPWGYRAAYAAVAQFFDVLQASEWIAVLLLFVSAGLVWKIATASAKGSRELQALLAVLVLVIFMAHSVQRDFLPATALQRAFALPLLLWTLWALAARRYGWVGVSWLAAALVYPVTLPVQGLTAGVVFLRELIATRRLPRHWITNGALGAAAVAIAALGIPIPPEVGPAYTYEQAMQMPEFGPAGRLHLYPPGTFAWIWDYSTGLGWPPRLLLLMAAAMVAAWLFRRLATVPFAAWVMVSVGVGLWIAMRLFPEDLMFGLYLPNRHSRWAIGIFGLLVLAAAAAGAVEQLALRLQRRSPQAQQRTTRWVAIAAPLVAAGMLLPGALRVWTRPVNTDLENVYAFIATLPKSTLVAAHPDLADFVPLRTHRSVLASTEISMAWMQNYYAQMKPRVEASLRAAYATSMSEVDATLEPLGVDVILSGPPVWSETGYFEPFGELVHSLLERGSREGFALQAPPPERTLYRSGDYYVVRVGTCTNAC